MAVFECPACNEILEVKPPDRQHSAFSSAKPKQKMPHSKIIQKRVKCKNKDCRKTVTVYWYTPLEFLSFNEITQSS
jgi:hypothetical protein